MATGGSSLLRGMATEPRVRASGSRVNRPIGGGVDDNFRFNWIGDKDEDRPNNYWDWKPSATFADPTIERQSTATAVTSAKKSKTKNKDREKTKTAPASSAKPPAASLPDEVLSTPSSREVGRRHTPATFPRTRNVASAMDRVELELLKRQLTFSDIDDQQSSDGGLVAANNVRRDVKPKAKINQSDKVSRRGDVNQHRVTAAKESTNVNEMPDRNQIVARLMQIRDYMKQASSMMANLNISPTGSDEQADKLMRLQHHLQEQERGYLALLEHMLSDEATVTAQGRSSHNSNESQSTSIAESASINIDAESDVSEATTGNMDIKTRLEELEGLRQQHELLQKMLQQQEELRALQNRQSALMKLQEDIEGRLKQSEDQNADAASHSTLDDGGQSEHAEDQLSTPLAPFDRSRGGLPSLSEQRRELLMKILSEDSERRASDMQRARMLDRLDLADREQKEASALSSEHEHLLDTLEALQQKKNHMDELLWQLQSLRPSIPGAVDTDSAVSAASSSQLVDPPQEQQEEVKEAQVVGSSDENEAMDKLRRLQEVRQRLDDLRDLVQQYQGFEQNSPLAAPASAAAAAASSSTLAAGSTVDETGDARKTSSSVNFEDPELMSNLRRLERGEPVGQFRPRNQELQQQLDAAEDGTSSQQSEDDSQLMTTDSESNHSLLQTWGDDPEIRGKIEKLQEAKRKLRQLQELVNMVQKSPEAAVNLPDDLAALAAGLQDEFAEASSSKAEQDDQNEDDSEDDDEEDEEDEEDETNPATSEMSEGGVPQVSQATREAYFEAKMQQQRRELGKLQEERQRLLAVQQQLRELNQQLPRMQQGVKATNTTRQNPSVLDPRQPSASNVQDTSTSHRETLIAEKLRHRRLQTELKLKQQELAALMDRVKHNNTGNVNSDSSSAQGDSNDNDLFRVSMRSADVTAAASWGGSTQQSDEDDDDDAFPSDGILQVEEEEEEQEQSLAGTTSTYTVEAAYRQPTRRTNSFPGQAIRNNTDMEALHGIRYPKWVSDPKMMSARRQQNLRAAEELMSGDVGGRAAPIPGPEADRNFYMYQIHQLQQQLQNSINLAQSMMRDQQCMNNMLQSSMSGGFGGLQPLSAHTPSSTTPTPTNSDPRMTNLMSDYNMRLQHQQLQLNMNYAYNQLYQQQLELQRIQNEAFAVPGNRAFGFEGNGELNVNNNRMNGLAGYDSFRATSPLGGGLYQPGAFSQPGLLDYTSPYSQMSAETPRYRRQQQQQRDYDAYARHRQEQDARQRDYHVPPNTAQGSVDQMEDRGTRTNDYERVPYAYAERAPDIGMHGQAGRTMQPYVPPLDIQRLLEQSEKLRRLAQQGSASASKQDGKKTKPQTDHKDSNLMNQARSATKHSPGPRPGLSSSLSGTAFMDIASMTSTMSMSSMPGDVEQQTKLPDTQREIMSTSEIESDAGSEFSLFEALRESIYSEVATLISQNEARPHYLIELFRELQMLNSDYLRQRALYSLQDLVAKFLTDEGAQVPTESAARSLQEQQQQQQHQQQQRQQELQLSDPRMLLHLSTTASEQTPSESMITSDEEEIKAQVYSTNPKKKDKPPAERALGSVDAEEYDYVESVGSASSLSTPPSFSQDFGFANDELGDTVIHLDKALQRMREYERLKAEAEASAVISSDASASAENKAAVSNSEVTSDSSAQDVGSESSFSDLPYPRIDTRQLDLQIKSIMQEVIPYLKEHMNDVCSPQLLSYIRRLVLTLSKQRDDSREFVRFFNRQLGSILQDSLAKFSGRKMRECGEDLLVDISEILFNELAFFRLMQDLDTAGSKLREEGEALGEEPDEEEEEEEEEGEGEEQEGEEGATGTETGNETGTAAEEEGSSSESESNSSLSDDDEDEAPSAGDQPPTASQPRQKPSFDEAALETAMDIATSREEEELGKTRDDDLARKLETSDRDEDSEEPLSKDHVKIELSMSETNAVTYLGSGEDDDELDELNARQDETITSIGAAAAQVDKEKQVAETTLHQEPAESFPDEPQASASLPNGSMDNNEVTIDDLPAKMTSLEQVDIEGKAIEEQDPSAVLEDIINTIVSGEAALAGDLLALKEPPTANDVTPGTNDVTPTTNAITPTTNAVTPTTSDVTPTTSDVTPTTSDVTPTTSDVTPTTSDVTPTTSNVTLSTSNVTPTTSDVTLTTSDVTPTTNAVTPTTNAGTPTTNAGTPTTSAVISTTSDVTPMTSAVISTTREVTPTTSSVTLPTIDIVPTSNDVTPTTNDVTSTTNAVPPTVNGPPVNTITSGEAVLAGEPLVMKEPATTNDPPISGEAEPPTANGPPVIGNDFKNEALGDATAAKASEVQQNGT